MARTLWPSLARPVFVVGAPRSGTTFLGSCLEALPELSYHYEPLVTQWLVRERSRLGWSTARADRVRRGTYRWLLRVHGEGDLAFAEKTPRNAFVVPELAHAFPDARFVHVLRDGRDVTLSLLRLPWFRADAAAGEGESARHGFGPWARFWVEPVRRAEFEATSDAARCAWAWRRYTEAVLDGFASLAPGRTHEVRYEDAVAEPEKVSESLAGFLGVDAAGSRAALLGALGGARATSVGGWREGLVPAQREAFDREAGALARRLGYA